MKCREVCCILLSSLIFSDGPCDHKFCQSCFRAENINIAINSENKFKCPCCYTFSLNIYQSIDEAILIGEGLTLSFHISTYLLLPEDIAISTESIRSINNMNIFAVEKLESALQSNPTSFYTLYLLFNVCSEGHRFLMRHKLNSSSIEYYTLKLFDYSLRLLDHPTVSGRYEYVRGECYFKLGCVFNLHANYFSAHKYAKLAYEHCLRSSDHNKLPLYKDFYLGLRVNFATLPPLRFAVGDEVKFLHELETGSKWKLGKVVELYYRQRDFAISFTSPYRLQLLAGPDSVDQPPAYAWVKADIDRYVRKVGVRLIERTRYQSQLDAKVTELVRVYCSVEFVQDLYRTLAQDREFIDMLWSVWQIELSERVVGLYHMYVLFREPLIRTDSGYHVPSSEEVIAGIRAFFDPAHLSDDMTILAEGKCRFLQEVRTEVLGLLRDTPSNSTDAIDVLDVQGLLLHSLRNYIWIKSASALPDDNFTVPQDVSNAISNVSTVNDLKLMVLNTSYSNAIRSTKLGYLLQAWIPLHTCLEDCVFGCACECPFVYFFVKHCLNRNLGVPKLALALYDRMSMQLSREFIRCANPACELNRLDKSTGKVKFKQCTRCRSVIYCGRECQTAHYPEHKALCRTYATDDEGS